MGDKLGAAETCACSTYQKLECSFELPCRPASSVLRYRADPRIYSAHVNFLFLALWKIGAWAVSMCPNEFMHTLGERGAFAIDNLTPETSF